MFSYQIISVLYIHPVCVYEDLWQICSSPWDSSPAALICSAFITEDKDPASLPVAALNMPHHKGIFSSSLTSEPVIIISVDSY